MKNSKTQSIVQLLLFLGILIFVNILGQYFYAKFDLTEEKRFTLTKPTQEMLNQLDDVVYVRVLLDGNFPAGFKRLQKATLEMLDDFRSETGYLEYQIENPSEGTTDEINARREELSKDGIYPTRGIFKEGTETKEQYFYPWAIFYFKGREMPVNLLENQTDMISPEHALNNSVSLLEYKFANAISKLKTKNKRAIVFTSGHGELEPPQTISLESDLRQFYNTGRLVLDSITQISPEIDVLVVARPRFEFSKKDKFKIDQFVMNGGKVLWMIDRLSVQLDSMQRGPFYVPHDYPLNLEDQLFRYGAKIEPNLVLDLECSKIAQVVGQVGGKPQIDYFRWFYHPTVSSKSNHPIVKNLDRINFFFPSSIDTTVQTKTNIRKTVLLESSQYTRMQFSPVRLNFEVLRYDPDPSKFNKAPQPLAVLLEGVFPSLYENRVPSDMLATMNQLGMEYKTRSEPTRMIVVSDGDVAKNLVVNNSEEYRPLGFNQYEKYIYANKEFLINSIEYLIDDKGVIEARGKEVKLRLLDGVKAKAEKMKWRLINILVPLLLLILFGTVFNFLRKRKYT